VESPSLGCAISCAFGQTSLTKSLMSKHLDPVELRGDIERDTVDFIDVVSSHRRMSRMELVEAILSEWVANKKHESTVVVRLARSKGTLTE
jgi:hypothetical protein